MFEKEAEEYAIENYEACLYDDLPYTNDSKAIEQAFENGAEFGYNKANEWNNVKDKLPVNDGYKTYIVIDKYNCSVVARFYNNKWRSYTVIRDVVLWKEIKLPSDKEVEQAIKDINKRTDKEPNVDNSLGEFDLF